MVWRPYALSSGLPCVDIPDSIDVLDTIDPRSMSDNHGRRNASGGNAFMLSAK